MIQTFSLICLSPGSWSAVSALFILSSSELVTAVHPGTPHFFACRKPSRFANIFKCTAPRCNPLTLGLFLLFLLQYTVALHWCKSAFNLHLCACALQGWRGTSSEESSRQHLGKPFAAHKTKWLLNSKRLNQ